LPGVLSAVCTASAAATAARFTAAATPPSGFTAIIATAGRFAATVASAAVLAAAGRFATLRTALIMAPAAIKSEQAEEPVARTPSRRSARNRSNNGQQSEQISHLTYPWRHARKGYGGTTQAAHRKVSPPEAALAKCSAHEFGPCDVGIIVGPSRRS
jgi:hypothetical protein